jgi:hypothetical protein
MESAFTWVFQTPPTDVVHGITATYPRSSLIFAVVVLLFLYSLPVLVAFVWKPRATTTVLLSTVTTILVVGMYYLLLENTNDFTSIILPAFLSCLFIWTLTFHWLAYQLGYHFRDRFGDGKPWARHWVKEIDYIYLLVSSVSLLKLVITQIHPQQELRGYNAVAAVALGTALALRITKTSIEVWDWDNPRRAPGATP